MKKVIALAALTLASSAVFAAIPETTKLTCADARNIVKRNGVINMTTNGGRYVRYVADASWCSSGDNAEQAWVRTLDAKHCPMAFVCVSKD